MRNLVLTLTVDAPHQLREDKLLLIKFIRDISGLGLKEVKDFVESVFFIGDSPVEFGHKVNISVPLKPGVIQVLCNLNNTNRSDRVPGVKLEVYTKPTIFKLNSPLPKKNFDDYDYDR